MTEPSRPIGPAPSRAGRFWRDERAASAVEFALVAGPFFVLILGILQVGIYYMTQASLDAGVTRTAETLRNGFTQATPSFPSAASLKSTVAASSGGMVRNNSTLAVEIRQFVTLSLTPVAITDGVADYGAITSPLVLRARVNVTTFAPGFGAIAQATSSAIVRRQGR